MTTDTSERGLERLICTAMTGHPCDPLQPAVVREQTATYDAGWIGGTPEAYDREYCVDLEQLSAFLQETRPIAAEALNLGQDNPARRKFLARLQGEITKRGIIDVLRYGIKHGPLQLDLFYGTPSPGNVKAAGTLHSQPFQRDPPAPLQPRRDAACPRPRPLHQRPACGNLRAEEQPDQTDSRGRRRSNTSATATAREALRVRPLRRPLRRG